VTPQLANRLATLQIAFTMSGLMSGFMVAVNHGLSGDFLHSWSRNWMVAFAAAYPKATAIVPLSRRWVEKVTRRETMKS